MKTETAKIVLALRIENDRLREQLREILERLAYFVPDVKKQIKQLTATGGEGKTK